MCRLWYSDVWALFKNYDVVIRVDSDISIKKAGAFTTDTLSSPHIKGPDSAFVTEGMVTLFGATASRNPYTNVMVANMTWIRSDRNLHMWFALVKATNCICQNRWGDLPLWGNTLAALKIDLHALPGWAYRHGSHHKFIVS